MNTELSRPWFAHYDSFVPRTSEVWNKPLYALLDEAADKYPNRLAVIFQNTRITYKSSCASRPNALRARCGALA